MRGQGSARGRGRSSPGSAHGSCARRSAGPGPPPTACSGPGRAACAGTGSLELVLRLVIGDNSRVAGHIADDLLARDVSLVASLAFARMLPGGSGVRVGVRMEEVRPRIQLLTRDRLAARLVGRGR